MAEDKSVSNVEYIRDGDRVVFRATIITQDNSWFEAEVDEVTTWTDDTGTLEPADYEPYLYCTIKWDGCSQFYFGDPTTFRKMKRDGYLHLCGAVDFKKHVLLVRQIYDLAFKRMGLSFEAGEKWTDEGGLTSQQFGE